MERSRDKIAAWIILILMTFAFGASFLNNRHDVAFAELNARGEREQRAYLRRLETTASADMLFPDAVDDE